MQYSLVCVNSEREKTSCANKNHARSTSKERYFSCILSIILMVIDRDLFIYFLGLLFWS